MDPSGVAAWRRSGYSLRERQLFRQPIRAKHKLLLAVAPERPSPTDTIKQYAVDHSFGLVPSFSSFTVTSYPANCRQPVPARRISAMQVTASAPVQFDKLYFLGDTHRYIQISDQLQLSRVDRVSHRHEEQGARLSQ